MAMQDMNHNQIGVEGNTQESPSYKLYSANSVGIATFFGSPLAGAYLMSRNYKVLGNQKNAYMAILYGVLTLVASFILVLLLPDYIPSGILTLPELFATVQLMKHLQGPALEKHLSNNGALESRWKAFGISIMFMVVIMALMFIGIDAFYSMH